MKLVTRIAPSPTGDMHVGTARTAYFNWLAARASGGSFILRIDDTDRQRSKPEYVDVITDTLRWLGLHYDSVHYQSQRLPIYLQASAKLHTARDGDAVRLCLTSRDGLPRSWRDEISGEVAITDKDLDEMEGMVLIKGDGNPAYNFASAVDDADLGVNFVIRGTDHVTNTSKQVVLWHLLGHQAPALAHVGLIAIKGRPLSKRDGDSSMLKYREAGYDPNAMLNFLARLGWGPTVDDKSTALLPTGRMLELFLAGGKMRNSLANMDLHKLESFDRKYKARSGVWRNKDTLMA